MEDNHEPVVYTSLYRLMKDMKEGEKLISPISTWVSARTYAHMMKEHDGKLFSVMLMKTKKTKTDYILILRTK